MNIHEDKVFSENPEKDLWRELLQFTYEANIIRYLEKNRLCKDEDVINCISGSFHQAHEYYQSAKTANLQIAPLLLYYGTTNLLYGMANLISGKINKVSSHGMNIFVPEKKRFIAETNVRFLSPKDGGVHVIARALGYTKDLTSFGDWKLGEFLDSIAEINSDYNQCYDAKCGKIIMLDVFNTPDGKVEKVYYTSENMADLQKLLGHVENIEKSYLPIISAKDSREGREYFILRHKINGNDISEISYSGQPYLRAAHEKNSKIITVPTILNMYISLFILASLCRYYPEQWSPFVLKDTTGEKLLIEKLMYYARRMIPNIVLNRILKKDMHYVSNKYQETDTIKLVGEHQVKDIIKKEIKNQMEQEQFIRKYSR